MSKTPKKHDDVDDSFVDKTPARNVIKHIFPFQRPVVWAALLDSDTWTHWLPIDKVTWTSPEPLSLGATRTIEIGKNRIDEYFFAWEDQRRMAFRFDASTLPINAFAEDYTLNDAENGCELVWRFHGRAFPLLTPVLNGLMRANGRKGLPKLSQYITDNPTKFGA